MGFYLSFFGFFNLIYILIWFFFVVLFIIVFCFGSLDSSIVSAFSICYKELKIVILGTISTILNEITHLNYKLSLHSSSDKFVSYSQFQDFCNSVFLFSFKLSFPILYILKIIIFIKNIYTHCIFVLLLYNYTH